MQVIGGVYVDNSLLDNDSYHFSEDDFTEEFHKILFGSIYNIHLMGTEKVNIDTIEHYLSQRPKAYGVYNANHGREYIQKLSEITQIATFDYYYKRMKKMTLFRQYSKIGVDVSWLYNPDDVLNVKKKQSQEDWLDNTSIEEIAELINDKIEAIKSKYADGEKDNLQQAGEDIENFLEDLKQNPEYGYPLYGDYINTITRGARLGKLYLRSASTGLGKALDNETLLPTPIGYRKVKDIKVGDYLFDADGLPTKVLRVFPQPEKKQVYVVHLADGREVRCCGDHLWRTEDAFNKVFRIKSTKEIYEKELKSATPYHYSNGRRKILIPMNKPVVYPKRELSTDIAEIVKKVKNELTEIPEEIAFNSIEIREEFATLFLNGMSKINFPNAEIAYSLVSLMRSLGRQVEIQERFDELQNKFKNIQNIIAKTNPKYEPQLDGNNYSFQNKNMIMELILIIIITILILIISKTYIIQNLPIAI
jgi:replicative DNA helicase